MADFYPRIEPYNTGRLKVSSLHEIYYEEVGNPEGRPVLFLHGGPGGGLTPDYRRFFDPDHYRVVLFDQRGAGRSTPRAELEENTTWDLVEDIERLRQLLKIDKWIVFGGSWGSTLSLSYAVTHPDRVLGLALRGIFLCREKEIQWFYQSGAHHIFPEAYEKYISVIPENERSNLVKAFYKRLTSDDKPTQLQAAKAWSIWEGSTSKLIPDENVEENFGADEFALAFARIECHYFTNRIFMPSDDFLLNKAEANLQSIPTEIVHGRYDVVCAMENAWELKKALPQANLHIVPDAGHSAMEPGIRKKLVEVMEKFKTF